MRVKKFLISSVILIVSCACLLSACHKKHKSVDKQHTQIIVAKLQTPIQKLFFSGTLAPITTTAVVSHVAGNISILDFSYGEKIKKAQRLMVIESKPLADNYRKAVNDFLQKKQAYVAGKLTFDGSQALYKAGVMARNDFISARTAYDNKILDYYQSQYALEKVLKTVNVDIQSIEALSLDDTTQVNDVLQRHFRHVEIKAPASGVALFPLPSENKSSDDSSASGKLTIGSEIKEGQLLLSIGDLSGLRATFDVSEVDINHIVENMPVIVTGNAFPGAMLHGVVTAVSAQANQGAGNGGGLSMFTVTIEIPVVPPKIMSEIRVGMTAKFEIDLHSTPRIMLPVNAVTQKNGQSVVTILDSKGKQKITSVVTGETTPTQVVIISGIHEGDKVVVHD